MRFPRDGNFRTLPGLVFIFVVTGRGGDLTAAVLGKMFGDGFSIQNWNYINASSRSFLPEVNQDLPADLKYALRRPDVCGYSVGQL